jgi:putative phosphoesterase
MNIGVLSDTHGFLDDRILKYFSECDEIWHAGDVGSMEIIDRLSSFKKLRAVYGNIDGPEIRHIFPGEYVFELEMVKVYMIHIGGYPPLYTKPLRQRLDDLQPDLFICGHSHIVKIIKDRERGLLHINPGASGKQGFHKKRTIVRFKIDAGKIDQIQLIELGERA